MKSNRFTKDAVVYACKKMSSFTSDVRKLLDILSNALYVGSRSNQKITTDDMVKCWRMAAEETGHLWQEQLPQFYRTIINVIKEKGGITTDIKIYQYMNAKCGSTREEIAYHVRQLEEMKIVKTKEKRGRGLKYMDVTLLQI